MEPTDREAQSETRCDFISQLYSRRRLNNATGNKRYPRGKLIWRLVSLNLPHCYLSLSLSEKSYLSRAGTSGRARISLDHGVLSCLFSVAASCEAKLPLIVRGSGNPRERPRRKTGPMCRAREEQAVGSPLSAGYFEIRREATGAGTVAENADSMHAARRNIMQESECERGIRNKRITLFELRILRRLILLRVITH